MAISFCVLVSKRTVEGSIIIILTLHGGAKVCTFSMNTEQPGWIIQNPFFSRIYVLHKNNYCTVATPVGFYISRLDNRGLAKGGCITTSLWALREKALYERGKRSRPTYPLSQTIIEINVCDENLILGKDLKKGTHFILVGKLRKIL